MLERRSQDWFGLRAQYCFGEAGTIDWSLRPFRKTWSWRKLGREACEDLLLTSVSGATRCLVTRVDVADDDGEVMRLSKALRVAFETVKDEPCWLIDCQKRWIVELTPKGALTLERLGSLGL